MSWQFEAAFAHASTICSWFENLPKEEVPPQWIWPFDDLVSEWFKTVEKAREKKFNNADNDSNWEETDLDENEGIAAAKRSMGLMF